MARPASIRLAGFPACALSAPGRPCALHLPKANRIDERLMARTFLYLVAVVIVLVIAALIVLRLWANQLTALELFPHPEFSEPPPLADNDYADRAMWLSHTGKGAADPARR